jgi:hypothetical protein
MRVFVKAVEWIDMKKNVAAKVAKLLAEGKCLSCEQPLAGEKSIRGCHVRCAKATYRGIFSGATTDAKRVEDGKWLPPGKPGRKPSNPVSVELSGA